LAAVWLQTAPVADQGGEITGLSRANLAQTVVDMTVKPHVAGSAQQLLVRDYLIRRLEGLGLSVEIQRANGVRQTPRFDRPIAFSPVENLIAVLPGRDRSKPAVALMAHYDFGPQPNGPPTNWTILAGTHAVLGSQTLTWP
jgi:acetylornithine deacetylase/succinyl-diaminopimelate desuccinylase-like protein